MSDFDTKHTPGPWEKCGAEGCHCGLVWGHETDEIVAFVNQTYNGWNDDVFYANWHLIAAAPDLYAACRNLENDDGPIPEHVWKMIQAALAKADGRDV